jgi:hypothetical protein
VCSNFSDLVKEMAGRERRVLEALLYAILFLLAQNLVPAIVVLRTDKNSVLRYLWVFWSVFIFYRWLQIPISHGESGAYITKVGAFYGDPPGLQSCLDQPAGQE